MAAVTEDDFSVIEREATNLMINGDIENAKKVYTNFIERQEENTNNKAILALARNNRGHLRYLTVDFHGAVQDYTVAIELDPSLAVSYYNRGQIHYRMGRFQLAIDDLERALDIDPNFTDAQDNLIQARQDLLSKNRDSTTTNFYPNPSYVDT